MHVLSVANQFKLGAIIDSDVFQVSTLPYLCEIWAIDHFDKVHIVDANNALELFASDYTILIALRQATPFSTDSVAARLTV